MSLYCSTRRPHTVVVTHSRIFAAVVIFMVLSSLEVMQVLDSHNTSPAEDDMKAVRMLLQSAAYTAVVLLALHQPASAAVFTFNTSDSQFDPGIDNQGFWSATLANADNNTSYQTGNSAGSVTRSFFTFNLSPLNLSGQQVTSATLELRRYGYSGDASETVQFFDVSTPAATLNNNTGASAAIFSDLGTGNSYGAFAISAIGTTTDLLSFALNSNAFTDIAAAAGGFFSIGGTCDTCSTSQNFFQTSSGTGIQRLVIQTVSVAAVPEPTSVALIGLALAALGIQRRRPKIAA